MPTHFLKFITLFVIALACTKPSFSSDKELLDSGKLLTKGYQELLNGDTNKAFSWFMKVPANDTNYTLSLSFRISVLNDQKKYDQILPLCQKGLDVADKLEHSFLVEKGNALINLSEYEKALNTYIQALTKYPFSHVLNFNKAIALKKLGQYNEYFEALRKTVSIYPFYAKAHRELGDLALGEGKTTQALMSYIMAILVEPESPQSTNTLVLIDQFVTSKYKKEPVGYIFTEGQDDFSEIDLILANYAALQKGYKLKTKANLKLIRQVQVFLETLEFDPNDKGYWNQLYASFYTKLWKEDMFEPFSYYLIRPSNAPKHQKLVKKHHKKISAFSEWGGTEIKAYFNTIPLQINGVSKTVTRHYNSNEAKGILAIGEVVNDYKTGEWVYFHSNGAIKGEVTYNEKGEENGLAKWFNERGKKSQEYIAENGQLNGLFKNFWFNGNPYKEIEFVNGEMEGNYKEFNLKGGIRIEKVYVKSLQTGPQTYYYVNGEKEFMFNRKDDKIEGPFTEYYSNGEVKEKLNYVEGILQGKTTSYHPNGQLASTYTYTNGKLNGPYEAYFANGKLAEKGSYKEGTLVGENLEYFLNGNLSQKVTYDESGKQTGISIDYDYDGVKARELDYKNGNIIAFRMFNKQGKIVTQGTKKGGDFDYTGLYADGTTQAEGTYASKGGKEGEWTFYDKYGNIESQSIYENNLIEGEGKKYYSNGQVKEITTYKEGVWQDEFTRYHENGEMKEYGLGVNGYRFGPTKFYDAFGELSDIQFFQNDELHGWQTEFALNEKIEFRKKMNYGELIEEVFFDSTGAPYDTLNHVNLSGKHKLHYPNGNVYFEAEFKNSIKDGQASWYFPNGQISFTGSFVNGNKQGEWKSFYSNGTLKKVETYLLGTRHGTVEKYHENGKIAETYNYEYGELKGLNKVYNEDGTLDSKFNYSMSKLHGKATYYGDQNKVNHIRYYHYGKKTGYSYLGKDGKEVQQIPFKQGETLVKSNYQNGNTGREYTIKNGEFVGNYLEYYSSGKLLEKTTYSDKGIIKGENILYYENGQKKEVIPYEKGVKHGQVIKYYPDGSIQSSSTYVKGYLYGKTVHYDKKGRVTSTHVYYKDALIDIL